MKKMMMCVAGAGAVLLLTGCAGIPTAMTAEPAGEVAATASAKPEGSFSDSCDYLLDFDHGHELVADAFLTNTGEVAFEAKVTATWRQAGNKAIVKTKTVTVPVGDDEVEVHMKRKAGSPEIDRIQALDTDRQCEVTVKMVGLA